MAGETFNDKIQLTPKQLVTVIITAATIFIGGSTAVTMFTPSKDIFHITDAEKMEARLKDYTNVRIENCHEQHEKDMALVRKFNENIANLVRVDLNRVNDKLDKVQVELGEIKGVLKVHDRRDQ